MQDVPSASAKNSTRPPPPAGRISSVNFTSRCSSSCLAPSSESTRSARCRKPASLLSAVSGREELPDKSQSRYRPGTTGSSAEFRRCPTDVCAQHALVPALQLGGVSGGRPMCSIEMFMSRDKAATIGNKPMVAEPQLISYPAIGAEFINDGAVIGLAGFSSTEGKFGLLGESGKCCGSMAKAGDADRPCRPCR